jgi:hypothetical protein
MQAWHEDFGNGPCPDYDAICYAINIIEEAPEGLDNLIKALEQEHKKLLEMQKAQPEIIRCKDCKYRGVGNYCVYGTRLAWVTKSNDFCSRAERIKGDAE